MLNIQISGDRTFAVADLISFIGLKPVDTKTILGRINGDGAQAEIGRRAKDANGNFGAVRRHNLVNGRTAGDLVMPVVVAAPYRPGSIWMPSQTAKTEKTYFALPPVRFDNQATDILHWHVQTAAQFPAEQSDAGEFVRQRSFREWISSDGSTPLPAMPDVITFMFLWRVPGPAEP